MSNLLTALWSLLSGLLANFGGWFKQILKDGETTYDTLETDAQAALQQGSGILAIFNADLQATPDTIKTLFSKAFPGLSLDVLHGFLEEVLNKMNAVEGDIPLTLDDAIVQFQILLQQCAGDNTFWGRISKFLAGEFTILLSPETPVQKIDDSLEYVYHLIVKPHVAAVVANTPVQQSTAPQFQASKTPSPSSPVPPAGNTATPPADQDMQISNEAAANLAGASDGSQEAANPEQNPTTPPPADIPSQDAPTQQSNAPDGSPARGETMSYDEAVAAEQAKNQPPQQ